VRGKERLDHRLHLQVPLFLVVLGIFLDLPEADGEDFVRLRLVLDLSIATLSKEDSVPPLWRR